MRTKPILAILPPNEPWRLDSLHRYQILDTVPDQRLDDLVFLASQLCDVPIAYIGFMDKHRYWLKSGVGIEVTDIPRNESICSFTILTPGEILVINDASQEDRFRHSPLVVSTPRIRFYAGAPIVDSNGAALGTLCVADTEPRIVTDSFKRLLSILAGQALTLLELRKALSEIRSVTEERARYEERLEAYQRRLEQMNASLSVESQTDKLTGVANRRHFDDVLSEEYHRAQRRGQPLSLIFIDVDHFKSYNDSFGHLSGDEALRRVAQILQESKRPSDFVARYGGEEFALLLPNTPEVGAVIVGERIRRGIQNHNWDLRPITISAGISTYTGTDHSIDQLVKTADDALFRSKMTGRNQVSLGALL